MCQFGMELRTEGQVSELGPVLKPTGFDTHSFHIARELHKMCPRDHKHVNHVGGRAAAAAIHFDELCQAICRGLAAQKREDSMGRVRSLAMTPQRLLSMSMVCSQASGGYPPEIVNKEGEFDISSLQMEVNVMGRRPGDSGRSEAARSSSPYASADDAEESDCGDATRDVSTTQIRFRPISTKIDQVSTNVDHMLTNLDQMIHTVFISNRC